MVRQVFYAFLVCLLVGRYSSALGQANAGVHPGDLVYQTDFDQGKGLAGWTGAGKLDQSPTRGSVLYVCQPGGPAANPTVSHISIPCEKYRGCLVLISAMVKGENVTTGRHTVKFEATAGNETYRGAIAGGTFDWKQAAVRVFLPWDATQMTLTLGLEAGVTGKVWFDDVRIQVRQVNAFPKGKVEMGPWKFPPRLRGVNIDTQGYPQGRPEEDYRALGAEWKANVLRWPPYNQPGYSSSADDAAYDKWLDGEIKRLDAALPILRKYGIYVVLDMRAPPGGGQSWDGSGLFNNLACQQKTIEIWRTLAKHYKGVKEIFGYDLVNEPIDVLGQENIGWDTVPGDVYNWWELADKIARAIREIDPETLLFVEPSPGGTPYAFLRAVPLNVPNVVYSLHMYMPYQFTHQLVFPCFDKKLCYPGLELGGEIWDGKRVRGELGHVAEFQQKWGARIYVGEFSAVRWAPGAYNYIKDLVDVFEANGWDWTYHSFREYLGWSVELNEDKDHPATVVTDRQKLLMQLFSKNEKPAW
jgi:endoglucanase